MCVCVFDWNVCVHTGVCLGRPEGCCVDRCLSDGGDGGGFPDCADPGGAEGRRAWVYMGGSAEKQQALCV